MQQHGCEQNGWRTKQPLSVVAAGKGERGSTVLYRHSRSSGVRVLVLLHTGKRLDAVSPRATCYGIERKIGLENDSSELRVAAE